MEINSVAGYFPVITDVVLVFCEPSSPHNSQRIDGNQQHNEENTYYHIKPHAHTTKHNQTQTNTNTNTNKHKQTQTQTQTNTDTQTHHPFATQIHVHFIPSGTRLAHFFDTNKFGQTGNDPKNKHSDSLASQSRVCTERESPTGRVIIVIVAARGERRQEREERREREKRREEREKREPPLHHHHHPSPRAKPRHTHHTPLTAHHRQHPTPHNDTQHTTYTTDTTHTTHTTLHTNTQQYTTTHNTLSAHTPHTLSTHIHIHIHIQTPSHQTHTNAWICARRATDRDLEVFCCECLDMHLSGNRP